MPRSASGSRRSAPPSARTCWPTSSDYALVLERGRSCRPAGLRARRGARGGRGARPPGKHVITLSRSSIEPFLQFSARRDLREKAFRAWIARGDNGGATDNKAIIAEMVALRAERARLLGYPSFAHYRLDDSMAKTPQAVRAICSEKSGRGPAPRALADRDALQALVQEEGGNFALAPWDWRYYAEKLRKAPLRHRRGGDQALPAARPDDRGGVRHRAAGCSA